MSKFTLTVSYTQFTGSTSMLKRHYDVFGIEEVLSTGALEKGTFKVSRDKLVELGKRISGTASMGAENGHSALAVLAHHLTSKLRAAYAVASKRAKAGDDVVVTITVA